MSVQKRVRDGKTAHIVHWREDGRQRSRSFTTRRDAEQWDAEVTRRRQLGTLAGLTGGARTLEAFITESWAPERAQDLAPATRYFYANLWRTHLAPTFAKTRLRDVTAPKVAAWRAQRARDGAWGQEPARGALPPRQPARVRMRARGAAVQRRPGRPPLPTREGRAHPRMIPPGGRGAAPAPRAPRRRARRGPRLRRAAPRGAARPPVARRAGAHPARRPIRRLEAREVKTTKTGGHRSVRLLAPLAADLAEWRMRSGRPAPTAAIFPPGDGQPWHKSDWSNWRNRRWKPGLAAAGLPIARPYDLRHSFASLLLAEGRTVHYVAGQLGHGAEQTLRTYGHVIAEWEDRTGIDAEHEIRVARGEHRAQDVGRELDGTGEATGA